MVACVKNGIEGLEKLVNADFDIIVMDCVLPKIYGKDSRIRIRQASPKPIIVIGESYNGAESFELGADAFMSRPLQLRKLVARVRSLLNRTWALTYNDEDTNISKDVMNDFPFFPSDNWYYEGEN